MLGEIHQIADGTLMVEGQVPRNILSEPDICNVLIHKRGENLYCVDTGATMYFRGKVMEAIQSLRPFKFFVLLNSHAHPDHIPNNIIIQKVEADVKKHYISCQALDRFDPDFMKLFRKYYSEVEKYYPMLDGPKPPYNLLFKPLKLARKIGLNPFEMIVKRSLKKFGPYDLSRETMTPYEDNPSKVIKIGEAEWRGWDFDGDVYALEARGHSADEIVFYFPRIKLLMLADESVKYFNCWPESSAKRIRHVVQRSIQMILNGHVDILLDSHTHEYFTGKAAMQYLKKILDDYDSFSNTVVKILGKYPKGATVKTIYNEVVALEKESPVIKEFLSYEFPNMPPFLKTTITCLLLEAGCLTEGPDGKKLFRLA